MTDASGLIIASLCYLHAYLILELADGETKDEELLQQVFYGGQSQEEEEDDDSSGHRTATQRRRAILQSLVSLADLLGILEFPFNVIEPVEMVCNDDTFCKNYIGEPQIVGKACPSMEDGFAKVADLVGFCLMHLP